VTGADGVNVAAPIFRAFLDKALVNYPIEDFPKYNPDDEIGDGEGKTSKPMVAGKLDMKENLKVCQIPDKKNEYCLASKYCRDKDVEKKNFVSDHSILYYVNRDDPRGSVPDKPERDAQYKNWEKGVADWYDKQKGKGITTADVPKDDCKESDFSNYKPSVQLTVPNSSGSSSLSLSVVPTPMASIKSLTR
jgi:hypothetical protein